MTEGVCFYTYAFYFIRKRMIMQDFSHFFSTKQGSGAVSAQLTKPHTRTVQRLRGSVRIQFRISVFSSEPMTRPLYRMALSTPPGRSASRAASSAGMLLDAWENTLWSAPAASRS